MTEIVKRLEMKGISKIFPGVRALSGVDLCIEAGEIHALVGENGAGKSTLMKILSGAYLMDEGEICFDGEPVEIHHPSEALHHGIVTIYQETNLSLCLSVAENVFCGRLPHRGPLVNWKLLYEKTDVLLKKLGAGFTPETLVEDLSAAQRQMVEIAKALSMSARLIVLDEPTAALSDREVESLFAIMRQLRGEGVSTIFITHRLKEIFQVADRVTILRDGRKIATKDVTQLNEEDIIYGMVGREIVNLGSRKNTIGSSLLEVRQLCGTGFRDISFAVNRGEILGLFGLVGSGRTELMRAIFGADPVVSGDIVLDGDSKIFSSPRQAIEAGVTLVPEDRKLHGLILSMPVKKNISLPNLALVSRRGFLDSSQEKEIAKEYQKELKIRCPNVETEAQYLSGGNQQKIVVAKWLVKQPKVLIVDEPTRGIDVAGKSEVHRLLNQLAESGVSVIMVSSELPEILGMADRVLVMHEGYLAAELDIDDASEELIMKYASG